MKISGDAIIHIGEYEKGEPFKEGEEVSLTIDAEKRRLYARLHSGGHLLDVAMNKLGINHLKPGKGYHFPVSSYVEYDGNIDNAVKD